MKRGLIRMAEDKLGILQYIEATVPFKVIGEQYEENITLIVKDEQFVIDYYLHIIMCENGNIMCENGNLYIICRGYDTKIIKKSISKKSIFILEFGGRVYEYELYSDMKIRNRALALGMDLGKIRAKEIIDALRELDNQGLLY